MNSSPIAQMFKYDQLNRIKVANNYWGINATTNNWISNQNFSHDYDVSISYSGDGNINTLTRYKQLENGTNTMDDLSYTYETNKNRLTRITDAVSTPSYPLDLETQTSTTNYTYYNDGNLKTDASEQIVANGSDPGISWNVYNKMTKLTKAGTSYNFGYDASLNRISKNNGSTTNYYVYDPKGNVLATYTASIQETITLDQNYIYGSSRIGAFNSGAVITNIAAPSTGTFTRTRGKRNFELANHLGNVLAVVSDRKVPKGTGASNSPTLYFDPDVLSAQDYYAFGQIMPGRYGRLLPSASGSTFVIGQSGAYRYGFNGKESDNEIKGFGNEQDYGNRVYDPRVARFLSVDPIANEYPELTPYQFASNSPISGIDLDGLEFIFAQDGQYLGRIGSSQEVYTADKIENRIVTNLDGSTSMVQEAMNTKSLNINHSDFIKFAGTAYAESSVGDGVKNKSEIFGIASTMINYKKLTGNSSITYAESDGNVQFSKFLNASDNDRNNNFMKTAIAAAINALNGGKDYSNGATNFAGKDAGGKKEKWAEGMIFTDDDHDIFCLGNNPKPGVEYIKNKKGKNSIIRGKYDYKWESTAAYGGKNRKGKFYGTIFMKVTDAYKKAKVTNGG